jgi:hypothetical protein
MRSWDIELLMKEIQNQFAGMLALVTFPYAHSQMPEDISQLGPSEYDPNSKEHH